MRLPQIRMHSSFAQIGIETKPARQTMEQPKADVQMEQPQAEVNIERIPSKLSIDQSQAWADMDLKSIAKRIEEAAQNGYQDWLAGLERRSQQGDQLMKIEHKGNAIASVAEQNATRPEKQFNIGWIPSYFSVKIDYEPAKVLIDAEPKKPIIHVQTNNPVVEYEPGEVNTSLLRKNQLSIDFINLKFKGPNYEQEI